MNQNSLRHLITLSVLASLAFRLSAADVVIVGKATSLTVGPNQERTAVKLTFRIDDVDQESIVVTNRGAPLSTNSYRLADEGGQPIGINSIKTQGGELLNSIILVPEEEMSVTKKYFLTVKPNTLFFQIVTNGTTNIVGNASTHFLIDEKTVKSAVEYVQKRQLGRSKIEIGGGTAGGAMSAEVVLDKSQFLNVEWMDLRLKANADVALSSRDREDFFNSIRAEAMFYRPIRLGATNSVRPNYTEIAVGGKIEADQRFDVVDAGASLQWAWFVHNKVTDWIGHAFVHDSINVPPLIVFSYSYLESVKQLHDGSSAASRDGDHHHRAGALLRYRLPIARELNFSGFLGDKAKLDLFADFQLKGVYDSASDQLHDQSWISLIFQPSSGPDRFKPAFSLTWARGKEAPTFQQVNALLAGLTLSF